MATRLFKKVLNADKLKDFLPDFDGVCFVAGTTTRIVCSHCEEIFVLNSDMPISCPNCGKSNIKNLDIDVERRNGSLFVLKSSEPLVEILENGEQVVNKINFQMVAVDSSTISFEENHRELIRIAPDETIVLKSCDYLPDITLGINAGTGIDNLKKLFEILDISSNFCTKTGLQVLNMLVKSEKAQELLDEYQNLYIISVREKVRGLGKFSDFKIIESEQELFEILQIPIKYKEKWPIIMALGNPQEYYKISSLFSRLEEYKCFSGIFNHYLAMNCTSATSVSKTLDFYDYLIGETTQLKNNCFPYPNLDSLDRSKDLADIFVEFAIKNIIVYKQSTPFEFCDRYSFLKEQNVLPNIDSLSDKEYFPLVNHQNGGSMEFHNLFPESPLEALNLYIPPKSKKIQK